MLNVVFSYCYAECHYTECHYAECLYAECRGADKYLFSGALCNVQQLLLQWCLNFCTIFLTFHLLCYTDNHIIDEVTAVAMSQACTIKLFTTVINSIP